MADIRLPNITFEQMLRAKKGFSPAEAIQSGLAGYETGTNIANSIAERKATAEDRKRKIAELERKLSAQELLAKTVEGQPKLNKMKKLAKTPLLQNPITQFNKSAQPVKQAEPTMLQTPQGQQQIQQADQQGQFAGNAIRAGYGDAVIKSALKTPGAVEGEFGSRGFQQSQIQITDESGKPKTVAASYDIATGQFVNPYTNQPIKDTSELSKLPERGYALNYQYVGTGEGQQPVFVESKTGQTFSGGETYGGVVFPKLQNAPAGIMDSLSDLKQAVGNLDIIKEKYTPDLSGPAVGRATTMAAAIGTLGARRAEFLGYLQSYQNAMIKAITGAQMSEPEAKRLMRQMPSINENPAAFLSKVDASRNLASLSLASKYDALKASNYVATEPPISEERARQLVNEITGISGINSQANPNQRTSPKGYSYSVE
jgi:hypothetical protein